MIADGEAEGVAEDGLPRELSEMPEMLPEALPYWKAFWVLCPQRPVGFGLGAIPLSAYETYFRLYEIDGDDREDFLAVLQALDGEYLRLEGKRKGDTDGA